MQTQDLSFGPPQLEIRCALPGCPWRVQLPALVTESLVRHSLRRLGWRPDPETGGLICGTHARAPLDA